MRCVTVVWLMVLAWLCPRAAAQPVAPERAEDQRAEDQRAAPDSSSVIPYGMRLPGPEAK